MLNSMCTVKLIEISDVPSIYIHTDISWYMVLLANHGVTTDASSVVPDMALTEAEIQYTN